MSCGCAERRKKIADVVNKTKITVQEYVQRHVGQPTVSERPQSPQSMVKK